MVCFWSITNETPMISQKKPMNFNSGAKKWFYFVPVNHGSSKFLEHAKSDFPQYSKKSLSSLRQGFIYRLLER